MSDGRWVFSFVGKNVRRIIRTATLTRIIRIFVMKGDDRGTPHAPQS